MALQIKAKTFPMPNLSQEQVNHTYDVATMEEDIENWLKNKLNDGFSFLGSVGGDAYIILIVKKE